MKNRFIKGIALVAMTSFVLFSCSTDNDAQSTTSSVKNDSSLFMRGSGQVYYGFENLMSDLYSDNETIEESVEYQADGETYLVSEVTLDGDLQGYFLENAFTKEVVYLSEDASSGTLSQWSLDSKGMMIKEVFDLTQDPNYAIYGFSPETPSLTGKKFWGTVYTYGAEFTGVDGNCYQGVYSTYYVCGIRTSGPKAVHNANGSNAYVPCGGTYIP